MLWQKCFFLGFEVCLLCWLQQRNHCFFWFLEVQCLFWQRRSDVQNQNIHRGILAIEFLGAVTSPEQSLDGNCWHINIDRFMRIDSREAWVAWLRQHVYIYIWPMVEHWYVYIYIHRNTDIYIYIIYTLNLSWFITIEMGGGVIEVGQILPKIEGKAWEIEDATF